jgi:hypothetical protein
MADNNKKIGFEDLEKIEKPIETETIETVETVEEVNNNEIVEETPENVIEPDFDVVVKEKFKTTKEFNDFLSEHEDLKSKSATLSQTKADLEGKEITYQQKLKEYEEHGAIEDEQYYKLAKLKKSNPDEAKLIEKVLFGNSDDMDLIKMEYIQNNPSLATDTKLLNHLIKKDFGLNVVAPDEEDEPDAYQDYILDKQANELKMHDKAESFKNKYLSKLDSIEVTKPKTEAEKQTEFQQYLDTWKPTYQQLESTTDEIFITDKGKDGTDEVFYNYKLNADEKKEYMAIIANTIGYGKYTPDKKTVDDMKQIADANFFYKNRVKILKHVIAETKKDEAYYQRKKHSGAAVTNHETTVTTSTKDPRQLAAENEGL